MTDRPFVSSADFEKIRVLNTCTVSNAIEKLNVRLRDEGFVFVYAKRAVDIQAAEKALVAIYNRNVFPDLKVTWGTYPDNLGHTAFPGCLRPWKRSHPKNCKPLEWLVNDSVLRTLE